MPNKTRASAHPIRPTTTRATTRARTPNLLEYLPSVTLVFMPHHDFKSCAQSLVEEHVQPQLTLLHELVKKIAYKRAYGCWTQDMASRTRDSRLFKWWEPYFDALLHYGITLAAQRANEQEPKFSAYLSQPQTPVALYTVFPWSDRQVYYHHRLLLQHRYGPSYYQFGEAHHVGQTLSMGDLMPGYEPTELPKTKPPVSFDWVLRKLRKTYVE